MLRSRYGATAIRALIILASVALALLLVKTIGFPGGF